MSDDVRSGPRYTLWRLVLYAAKLGSIGFGGPVGLIGYMYRDLVERRKWISEAAGIAFVLPSFLMVVALGWLYLHFGGLGWMQAAFYGVGAAVVGIIAMSAYKLARQAPSCSAAGWPSFRFCTAAGSPSITGSVIINSSMRWQRR